MRREEEEGLIEPPFRLAVGACDKVREGDKRTHVRVRTYRRVQEHERFLFDSFRVRYYRGRTERSFYSLSFLRM